MLADLVITAANVTPGVVTGQSVFYKSGAIAGETLTAGQPVYQNVADSKWYRASATTSLATSSAAGITVNGATAGQPVSIIATGPLNFGAILTAGKWYVVSTNAGGIAPIVDQTSTWFSTILMYAYSTSIGIVGPIVTGVQIP